MKVQEVEEMPFLLSKVKLNLDMSERDKRKVKDLGNLVEIRKRVRNEELNLRPNGQSFSLQIRSYVGQEFGYRKYLHKMVGSFNKDGKGKNFSQVRTRQHFPENIVCKQLGNGLQEGNVLCHLFQMSYKKQCIRVWMCLPTFPATINVGQFAFAVQRLRQFLIENIQELRYFTGTLFWDVTSMYFKNLVKKLDIYNETGEKCSVGLNEGEKKISGPLYLWLYLHLDIMFFLKEIDSGTWASWQERSMRVEYENKFLQTFYWMIKKNKYGSKGLYISVRDDKLYLSQNVPQRDYIPSNGYTSIDTSLVPDLSPKLGPHLPNHSAP
uniref:Uncharacterized protein n=1 Tax=Timema genevievae TaxID=629358 RepID=A0A7R9PK95_TIMGE|nr:unnamed protein product [Timema genevievae]